jgi:hypothetical protein
MSDDLLSAMADAAVTAVVVLVETLEHEAEIVARFPGAWSAKGGGWTITSGELLEALGVSFAATASRYLS